MLERIRKARSEEGFTLIELLIVIIILGILAAIVVFAVSGVSDRGQTAADQTSCKIIRTAEEAYFAKNGSYAADQDALQKGGFLSDTNSKYSITVNNGGTPTVTVSGPGC